MIKYRYEFCNFASLKVLRIIGYPFSLLYAGLTAIRNRLYDRGALKSFSFKVPVIVVGNLSVGGSGKTPQIEYLVRLLSARYGLAVLSRGYKRKSKGFLLADKTATALSLGDEPFQYYQKFTNIKVAVDEDRVRGIATLLQAKEQPEVVLLDDAFQHRRLKAGLTILLTPYHRLYIDDAMLPFGELRESATGAKRAHIIIVTKCPENLTEEKQQAIVARLKPAPSQAVYFTAIDYENELRGAGSIPLASLPQYEVLLVTGIANPTPLLNFLKAHKVQVCHLKYPDHHFFTEKDIRKINSTFAKLKSSHKLMLTTEKDYVRISDQLEGLYYLPIRTKFIHQQTQFDNNIINYVEQGSRNS